MGCCNGTQHIDLKHAQNNEELSGLLRNDLVIIKSLLAKYPFDLHLALSLLPKEEIDKLTEKEKALRKVAASISPDMKIQIENKMKNDLSERTSLMLKSKDEFQRFKNFIEENKSINDKIQSIVQKDPNGMKFYILLPYSVLLENLEDHVYKHDTFKQFDQVKFKLEMLFIDVVNSEKSVEIEGIKRIYLDFDNNVFSIIALLHD